MWSLYNFMGITTYMGDWASSNVKLWACHKDSLGPVPNTQMEGKKQNKNKWQWQLKQLEVRPGKEAKHVNEVDDNEAAVFWFICSNYNFSL